jgi:hypothetical protein
LEGAETFSYRQVFVGYSFDTKPVNSQKDAVLHLEEVSLVGLKFENQARLDRCFSSTFEYASEA